MKCLDGRDADEWFVDRVCFDPRTDLLSGEGVEAEHARLSYRDQLCDLRHRERPPLRVPLLTFPPASTLIADPLSTGDEAISEPIPRLILLEPINTIHQNPRQRSNRGDRRPHPAPSLCGRLLQRRRRRRRRSANIGY